MKKLMMVSWALLAAHFSGAQEKKQYEVKNFKGLVSIQAPASGLVIQGHAGTSVIIEAEGGEGKVPEKAKGLSMVTAGGVDNTGMGATVEEETAKVVTSINEKGEETEEEIRVLSISIPGTNKLFKNYVVKIPNGLSTRFREGSGNSWAKKEVFKIQSLKGELDVNCTNCDLEISDFSGNIVANNSTYGATTRIEFTALAQDKITSVNTQGEIEVILPASSKANLRLNSLRGNVFTDFDLKKAVTVHRKDSSGVITVVGEPAVIRGVGSAWEGEFVVRSGSLSISPGSRRLGDRLALASVSAAQKRNINRYDYTINEGGVYVSITTSDGNLYLKKK